MIRSSCVLAACFLATSILATATSCRHDAAATPPAPAPAPAIGAAGTPALAGPFAHDNLQVWLVKGADAKGAATAMVPLAEALRQGLVVVHETGNVNELAIENTSKDCTVYVQTGDIVQGGKQDRTIGVDLALAPGSGRLPLPSFCVEHGRWTARSPNLAEQDVVAGTTAAPASAAHYGARFASSANSVGTSELKKAVLLQRDQQTVWNEVANTQGKMQVSLGSVAVVDRGSPTSLEMTLNTKPVEDAVAGYVTALQGVVAAHGDAIGCVVAIGGRLESADTYGSHALFAQMWPKLLRSAATAALARKQEPASGAALTAEQVQAFVAEAAGAAETREVAAGVHMSVGENAVAHVVDSRAGDAVFHRTWLAK
jgi:hypothetical protein